MPWADPRQLIEAAQAGGYAVGAFNMHNEETTQALVRAAEQAEAPVFLQVGRAIAPHMEVRRAAELTRRVAAESGARVVLHLDHGPCEEVYEAIQLGFGSIIYDGTHLPFEENIRTTRHVVQVAHSFGIPVEAELGKIPDADQEVDWQSYYTDVAEAERFVAETGVDWLAISVGIVHGVPTATPQPLDIQRIKDIKAVTDTPLELHGASGVPDDEIRAAIEAGVHKFNAGTDLRHAFRAGIEETWAQGDRQLEEAMAAGRDRMIAATVERCASTAAPGRPVPAPPPRPRWPRERAHPGGHGRPAEGHQAHRGPADGRRVGRAGLSWPRCGRVWRPARRDRPVVTDAATGPAAAPASGAAAGGAFGDGPIRLVVDAGSEPPQQAMDRSLATLRGLARPAARGGGDGGVLRIHRPQPTAAFSRRDSLAAGFPAAAESARAHGFEPVVRPAGGRLAAYHRESLVLDLVARHPDPRRVYRERFAAFGQCLAAALGTLGLDARVGPVPGEYCPGEFSVNAGGATKLAGTAQRLTAHGFLFSAVLLVRDPGPVREVLRAVYPLLGLDWRPATVGCVADHAPAVTVEDVLDALRPALARLLPLAAG